jgi:large subunit ribosomal protein L7/L12
MTKDEILEAIKQMSVIDLSELVKSLESEFGITAAAPVAVAAVGAPAAAAGAEAVQAAPADDEQFEFAVVLQEIGPNKINVIKAVREVTTLGLRAAKELVESAPTKVKEAVPREDADKTREALEAAGATIKIE